MRGLGCLGCFPFGGILFMMLPLIAIAALIYFLVNRQQRSGPPNQPYPPQPYPPQPNYPPQPQPPVQPPQANIAGGGGFCPRCGVAVAPGARFCPGCGSPMSGA
jgi:hypothetical protein